MFGIFKHQKNPNVWKEGKGRQSQPIVIIIRRHHLLLNSMLKSKL